MAQATTAKDDMTYLEEIDKAELSDHSHSHLNMPAGLAALSESEYNRLGQRATLKMDLVIMPCVFIMYVLNYLDRQNIASAKLAGFEADLNLSPVDYQTTVSILFVGYSESCDAPQILIRTLTTPKFSCKFRRT